MTLRATRWHRTIDRAEHAMSRDIVTVRGDTSIGAAVDAAFRRGRGHVVVVDEGERFVDMVPAQLLTMALLTKLATRDESVARVIDPDPLAVGPRTPLLEAVSLMVERGADAAAVVDVERRVLGLLTWADIGQRIARSS